MKGNKEHGGMGFPCACCDGGMTKQDLANWEQENLKKNGFYIHAVPCSDNDKFMNFHTHGFDRTWDHPDFQMVFPIPPGAVRSIFWTIADRVKAGEKFKAGDLVEKVIKDLPVMFVTAHEGGRQLLRIIFPDKNGKFPNEKGCDRQFALQPAVEGGSYEEKQ